MGPQLELKKEEAIKLSEEVLKESEVANEKRLVVEEEERMANLDREEIHYIQQEAQSKVNEAKPIIEAALEALDSIDKQSIAEIKTLKSPPPAVKFTLECVMVLLVEKTEWSEI